ncbi:MAG TPA: DegT/DnrJ/EryC1/StrS family aminotransferase [Candidatus Binataceae bacterium]|nr:DegT/DnrJ/EryC1/StrS family aminotransferase [Candidatus Binataceae bacterium]
MPVQPAAPTTVPLLDLKTQFRSLRPEIMAAITAVMESQQFVLGPQGAALEREIAAMVGVRAALGCASGSDALMLALMAIGIGPGDEVICPTFTFVATAGAVARLGARPRFVDIDPLTFTLDCAAVAQAITARTRAIIPVHLYGLTADMQVLDEIARRAGARLIEDAAQALGARYHGRAAGALGALACLSFYPTKNLGGAGDGGMVLTDDSVLAERLAMMRDHGSRRRYEHEIAGVNSRLDEIQAAIVRVKLPRLAAWNQARSEVAARYRELLAGLAQVQLPVVPSGCEHVYHQFAIRCARRDELRQFLRQRGVASEVYYPIPLHLQPAFAHLGYRAGELPQAEAAAREVLCLPIYPELTPHQQELVADAIRRFYAGD